MYHGGNVVKLAFYGWPELVESRLYMLTCEVGGANIDELKPLVDVLGNILQFDNNNAVLSSKHRDIISQSGNKIVQVKKRDGCISIL